MRFQAYGWMLLAGLWAGDARALEPRGGIDEALANAGNCAEALALLAAASEVSEARDAQVNAFCEAQARQPRHDPATEIALEQWHRANLAALRQHVNVLAGSNDPRDLIAAAMLAPGADSTPPATESEWTSEKATLAFAAARRLGPDDRLVAWLAALGCPLARDASDCDRPSALARLQRLEPDNAAVWIPALDQAVADGDGPSIDRLLARAAASARYEVPFGELGLLLYKTLRYVDAPTMTPRIARAMGSDSGLGRAASADDAAEIHAMAIVTAVALPSHQPLRQLCIGPDGTPALASRLPACIAIYTHMAHDALLVSQSVALNTLARLTADAAEGPQWRERLRTMHWVQSQASALLAKGHPEHYLQSVWQQGEVPALEGLLRAAGVPTTPPPGWLPNGAYNRALIATGRPPPPG